ncbi:hypothetical protein [Mucilaginibacter sp.]|uniref:hypothetical protein n=1 Tax=Mucilaginibacter sp. TaxID=1882438 RepID=UPI003265300B
MKAFKIFLFTSCLLASANLSAQTPQSIETGLLKSFNRIGYWDEKLNDTTFNAGDSLDKANDVFGAKLKAVAEKYPGTIALPFLQLKKASLDIVTSSDGLFRIYWWDIGGGGTIRLFANVFQYKTDGKTKAKLLLDFEVKDKLIPYYTKLYMFKTANKTYYLGIYGFIESSRYAGAGIKIFAIENGQLNTEVKLLKTQSGLKNEISYEYDFGSVNYKRPVVTFDSVTHTIKIPLVTATGRVTKKFITYKFTGKYFEKVTNLAK